MFCFSPFFSDLGFWGFNRIRKFKQNVESLVFITDFAVISGCLVVGIDVGSEFHYARAFDWRGIEFSKKPFKFSNTEQGFIEFKAWILHIQTEHDKDSVVPGMEPTGHYWFNLGKFLQDNGMKPVLVNPHHVKKSKELDDNNPTKNDRKDPKVIAGLVREGRYMIPYLPDGVYADLSWGLSGVHHKDFKVMDDKLYPIFGSVGVTYRLK